jgi:hypothetical protein
MTFVFDPDRILWVLHRREVRFVVIGGLAGNLLGTADITNDLDICYARDRDNLERLAEALKELGARLRVTREPDADLPFQLDATTLANGDSFTFATDAGDFDILGTPRGTHGFEDLDAGAADLDLGEGLVVRVASIDDLMRMKRASARAKDLLQLEHLGALRDEIKRFRAEGLDPQQGS